MANDNDLTNRLFSIPFDEGEAANMYFAAQRAARAAEQGIKTAGLGLKSLAYSSPFWLPGLLAAACGQIPIPTPVQPSPTAQVIVEPTKQEQMKSDLQRLLEETPTATSTPTTVIYTPTSTATAAYNTVTSTPTAQAQGTPTSAGVKVYTPNQETAPVSAIPKPTNTPTPGQQEYATQAQLEEIASQFLQSSGSVASVLILPFTRMDNPDILYKLQITVSKDTSLINGTSMQANGKPFARTSTFVTYGLYFPERVTVLNLNFPTIGEDQPLNGSSPPGSIIYPIKGGKSFSIAVYEGKNPDQSTWMAGLNNRDARQLQTWINAGLYP